METKKLTFEDLNNIEKEFILALRDPIKGPKLREYIYSTDTYKAMIASKGRS